MKIQHFTLLLIGLAFLTIEVNGADSEKTASSIVVVKPNENGKDEVETIQKDGKILTLTSDKAPAPVSDALSDLVEKFLRKVIIEYENFLHPATYTELNYIKPGEDLGVIDKVSGAKVVPPDQVPEKVRKALGSSTDSEKPK